ncbi:hypothetical protein LY76DRAFT_241104 [Colletotrichum caudatum]|nr:hypothetical protein LY76DRAFT_241104 [Colletotrichum caudatum]
MTHISLDLFDLRHTDSGHDCETSRERRMHALRPELFSLDIWACLGRRLSDVSLALVAPSFVYFHTGLAPTEIS